MGRMNTMKWAVYFLSFFGATGCTPVPVEGAQDGVLVHQVSYDLLWSEEDPSSDTVVNHLGFTVSIELAYLVHYSMQLVPCREDISARHSLWSPWTAVAGHGDDNDASVSSVPVVEAIHARAAHWAQCRSVRIPIVVCITSSDQPRHPLKDCLRRSRWWTVRCTFAGTGVPKINPGFRLVVLELAYGALRALPSDSPSGAIDIRVTRHLSSLFNDIDFIEMSEAEQLWQFLINAVEGAHVGIQSSE